MSVSLKGPFQSQDGGELPKFKLDAAFEGAGQSITAGATSTGDKGFISFQGTDYAVEDPVFKQFKAGFEEAQKAGGEEDEQSFASLGMDPRKWLTDPKNEGDAKVGDDDTIKITGGVDVAKLLDDVNTALGKASSLGLSGAARHEVPEKLTEEQRQAGARRGQGPEGGDLHGQGGLDPAPAGRRTSGVQDAAQRHERHRRLDVSITDLNEDQDIAEPADAKPFDELLGQFGGLGASAARPAAASSDDGGRPPAARPRTSRSTPSASPTRASDVEKARKCADLLTG